MPPQHRPAGGHVPRCFLPPPEIEMSVAWRRTRAARLVHKVAGLLPADAPRTRVEIAIVAEATGDRVAWAGAPGLAVEQVCRPRRIAAALITSATTPERTLMRHQQKAVPFLGTMPAEGIDIAKIAAGWNVTGERVAW